MSPRKLTEDDKQEILQLYRNSEATTSTLANDYEVSSSTISRFLKNKLSSTEYEDLIQQKRLARTPRGEKASEPNAKKSITKKTQAKTKTKSTRKPAKSKSEVIAESTPVIEAATPVTETETAATTKATVPEVETTAEMSEPKSKVRRRRRRSKAEDTEDQPTAEVAEAVEVAEVAEAAEAAEAAETVEVAEVAETIAQTPIVEVENIELDAEKPNKLVIDRKPSGGLKSTRDESESASSKLVLKGDRVDAEEDDNDEDEVDLVALKEMLGEDLEDFNDDDDEDDEDWEDEDEAVDFATKAANLSNIEILPLSQASLPRTCYVVIDRSAELIVKPLAEFADLGAIPQEEVRQRTLPIFDNHRIAKRFSHRRERVIKVPDGRMIQKTSHHLQDKGITRLLIDGQIYSLSH